MLGSGVVKLPSNFMKMTQSILEENEAFCEPNGVAHETWVEIVELMNDAVDNIMWETTDIDWKSAFPRYAMLNVSFFNPHASLIRHLPRFPSGQPTRLFRSIKDVTRAACEMLCVGSQVSGARLPFRRG